jgi:hypothetical protein
MLGCQQQEDEVDRLIVDRVEFDRRSQTREQAIDAGQSRDLAMRNGDAMAEPGRAQLLALQQRLEDHPVIDGCELARRMRNFLKKLLLVLRPEAGEDRLRIHDLG